MGLLARAVEQRSTLANPQQWLLDYFGGPMTAAGKRVSALESLQYGAVYACIRILSETVASLPLPTYRRLPAGGKERAENHPYYALLHDRPNPEMTALEFFELVMGHLLLWGNHYSELERDGAGRVIGIWPLRPDRMSIFRLSDYMLLYRYTHQWGEIQNFTADQLFHVKGKSHDGVLGLSTLALIREQVGLGLALQEHAARFFGNNSNPGGVLQHPGKLSKEGGEHLRKQWEESHKGLENAHRVAVLEEGTTWQSVGIPPQDAQLLEERRFQRTEIAGIYGVPPHLIGDVERSTSWGCLPGDTPVFTLRGPVPIADVRPGDDVWSLGESGLVPARVQAQRMTGIRQVRAISTIGRTLRLTDNHRLPVRRYRGKSDGRRKGQSGWETEWVRADEVRPGDFIAVPHGLVPRIGHVAPNGRLLTVGAMEFCGAYLGNGSKDGARIEIAHAADSDSLEHYRSVIRVEFGAGPYTDPRGTRTRFSSEEAMALVECGFTGYAHTKRVPGWVFGLAPELIAALLRGYVDTDGAIQRGRIVYSSVSKLLLEDVRHLCMQIGVPVGGVHLIRAAGPHVMKGRTVETRDLYRLALSSVAHNARIGSNSARKRANLAAKQTTRALTCDADWRGGWGKNVLASQTPGGTWPYDDLKLLKVRSNTPVDGPAMPVYDLQIEGTPSFIADGVLVHNSGIEQQVIGFLTFTIRPWLARIEQALLRDVFLPSHQGKLFPEFLVDGLLRGDALSRAQSLQIQTQNGALTPNEWRAIENRNPVEGGDVLMAPLNMAPLGTQPAMQGAPAAPSDPGEDDPSEEDQEV